MADAQLIVKVSQRHSRGCTAKDGSKLFLVATEFLWLTADGRRPRGNKLGPVLWYILECRGGSGEQYKQCRAYVLVRRDSIEAAVRAAVQGVRGG